MPKPTEKQIETACAVYWGDHWNVFNATKVSIRETMSKALSAALAVEAGTETEKLGRFGHHPDPAIDYCIEVEALDGYYFDATNGIGKPSEGPRKIDDAFRDRVERALDFIIGGDLNAIAAKSIVRRIAAALTTSPVDVKPLEWVPEDNGDFIAQSVIGWYHIGLPHRTWNLTTPQGAVPSFDTIEAAKAAAQADYEARIRSALTTSPASSAVEGEAVATGLMNGPLEEMAGYAPELFAERDQADWWLVRTDMGKVIFHGPDKARADRVAAIHGRTAEPLWSHPAPTPAGDAMLRLAVAAVLEADKEFRSNMGPSWEGDPLSDEIDGLRRIFEALPASPAPQTEDRNR